MHIETHTKEEMINSLCGYLNVSEESLLHQIEVAMRFAQVSGVTHTQIFYDHIREYVKKCNPSEQIDYILFFHLSRRLNSAINADGLNLKELLLNKTEFSDYLAAHEITFKEKNDYIEVYYKETLKELDVDNYDGTANVSRLITRLGQCSIQQDYCINGFAFKDQLQSNDYTSNLFNAPEFIEDLAEFLEVPSMLDDYAENSTYYCYEYLVPLSEVLFDKNESLSEKEKVLVLIESVCSRIREYSSGFIYDHDNPMLRLADNARMPKEYFVGKEEMLKD